MSCQKPPTQPTVQLLRWTDKQFLLVIQFNFKNMDDVVNEPTQLECCASGIYTSTQA